MDSEQSKIQALEKELEELRKEKKTLVSIVSHDLKSPFNRVFALTSLMQMTDDNLNAEQKEYMGKMHQVVKDGLALIKNLLDVRSLENNGIAQEMNEIDIVHLVKKQMKAIKPLADIKKIKLKFHSDDEHVTVTSDKQYLSRIIDNLLSNALKFSELETSIEVSVLTNPTCFKIGVRDYGPGISQKDQELMYQKYQKLTALPTDGESATGLGLFITKALVELLNGEIKCNSEVGKGTEFIVEIPINNQSKSSKK